MTVREKLDIVKEVIDAIEADLIDANGAFKPQPDFRSDEAFVSAIEAAYVAHGGVISPNVQKVIAGVEAVLAISGVIK